MKTHLSTNFRIPPRIIFILAWLSSGPAQAAINIIYFQEPGGVRVSSSSGSLRWSGGSMTASSINGGWNSGWVHGTDPGQYVVWNMLSPNYGLLTGFGSVISNDELSAFAPSAIRSNEGSFTGSSNVGIQFNRDGIFRLVVPSGYTEGSALIASEGFFADKTLADFSLSIGQSIIQTWTHAGGTDSFTIQAIPEVSVTVYCLIIGVLLLGKRRAYDNL